MLVRKKHNTVGLILFLIRHIHLKYTSIGQVTYSRITNCIRSPKLFQFAMTTDRYVGLTRLNII